MVQVLYFNYKTYSKEVYKVKETATGAAKIIVKDETFNPVLTWMVDLDKLDLVSLERSNRSFI